MIKSSLKFLKRNISRGPLERDPGPVSRVFGSDRGTPIDRYYIESFLQASKAHINGKVLEIAASTYSRRFGNGVTSYEVMHFTQGNPEATMIGDLTDLGTLPDGTINCFICTQTIHMIYDFKAAISGTYKVLKPGGVLLATLPGITQVSRYDMDRWGDYWRFTTLSALKSFEDVYGAGNVSVDFNGNCLAATNFLRGFALEELSKEELGRKDQDYPVVITIIAKKVNTVW
jgi:SAM-dependent methyltransferase